MDSKEILKRIRKFSDLEIIYDSDKVEIIDRIYELGIEYFEIINELNDEFEEIYLNGDLELLKRITTIISQAILVWESYKNNKVERITINLVGNNPKKISADNFLTLVNLKLFHLESLKNKIESLTSEKIQSSLKISNKKGSKINIYRILNALYDLKLITKTNNIIPSKKEFFKEMGLILNSDFSNYESSLSQSLNNQSLEINIEIFNDMIELVKRKHYIGE